MTPEEASLTLDKELRQHPWYISTGVAKHQDGTASLIVYVKSARASGVSNVAKTWHGYKVDIRSIGSIRPAGVQQEAIPA